jgi:hypothetical protein
MPKKNTSCIVENGRIIIFHSDSLLASHISSSVETIRRWRRSLEKKGDGMVKYVDAVMIDFEPEIYTNGKD